MFALAVPAMDDTTTVKESALTEPEWMQVKYAKSMLERSALHLMGVIEAGAETPWEEATALLQKQLDPDVYEETSGAFVSVGYEVWYEAMVDFSVVGDIKIGTVTTG